MNPRIIFLDIDGVVNTTRSALASSKIKPKGLYLEWDVTACKMIANLCKYGDFQIVVSSTWRYGDYEEHIGKWMRHYGLHEFVYVPTEPKKWKTPESDKYVQKTLDLHEKERPLRGHQIKAWMKNNFEPSVYFILDDDSDFLLEQQKFLIKTDSDEGFSSKDFDKINDFLSETLKEESIWRRMAIDNIL